MLGIPNVKENSELKGAMMALSLLVGAPESLASSREEEQVGELICTVDSQTPISGMLCVFRNRNTGVEEIYQGSLVQAVGSFVPLRRTMLWTVSADIKLDLTPGVLAQRYEPPESEQTTTNFVEGDTLPGVSLSLITDKIDDLKALTTFAMELKLLSVQT